MSNPSHMLIAQNGIPRARYCGKICIAVEHISSIINSGKKCGQSRRVTFYVLFDCNFLTTICNQVAR